MYYNKTFKNGNTLDVMAGYSLKAWALPLNIDFVHVRKSEAMDVTLIGFTVRFLCFYFNPCVWYENDSEE